MKKRWGKGEPVNLSDFLKITPVANEIMQLSDELNVSTMDVLWIVSQIIDNNEEIEQFYEEEHGSETELLKEEWDEMEGESPDGDVDKVLCTVNVQIYSNGRFPEVGFKAGIADKDDINYFFDMVMDILEKLDLA